MPRWMVAVLVIAATIMSALAAYAHGGLVWATIATAAAAAGLAAYVTAPPDPPSIAFPASASPIAIKKISEHHGQITVTPSPRRPEVRRAPLGPGL